jgi:hypothetical protein
MQGINVKDWNGQSVLKENEYAKHPTLNTWYCCTPNGHMGNLAGHTITENENDTITVSPSILVQFTNSKGKKQELWHGYLENGIWRSC